MTAEKHTTTELMLAVCLAPVIAIIYLGFLLHLAFLYVKLVISKTVSAPLLIHDGDRGTGSFRDPDRY